MIKKVKELIIKSNGNISKTKKQKFLDDKKNKLSPKELNSLIKTLNKELKTECIESVKEFHLTRLKETKSEMYGKECLYSAKLVKSLFGSLDDFKEKVTKKFEKELNSVNKEAFADRVEEIIRSKKAISNDKVIEQFKKRYNVDLIKNKKTVNAIDDVRDKVLFARSQDKLDSKIWIEKRYAELACKLNKFPTMEELSEIGVTREMYRQSHGDINSLRKASKENFQSYFEEIYTKSHIDNDLINKWATKTLENADRIVAVGVANGGHCINRLNALLNYVSNFNKTVLAVIPICKRVEDIDPRIIQLYLEKKIVLIIKDYRVHKNLWLKYIVQDEKTKDPISGLEDCCEESVLVAGTSMRFRPVPTRKNHLPRALMSTGVISKIHFRTSINHNKNPNNKRIKNAEGRQFFGAWVVEKVSKRHFIPRQLMLLNDDGSFPDWGKMYHANGKVTDCPPIAQVYGDTHSIEKDEYSLAVGMHVQKTLKIPNMIQHDIFDGKSVSPHTKDKSAYKIYQRVHDNKTSLSKELKILAQDINMFNEIDEVKKTYIVDSNHDDMLLRAFERGDILRCAENGFVASLIHAAAILSHARGKDLDLAKLIEKEFSMKKEDLERFFPQLFDNKKALEVAVELFGLSNKSLKKTEWLDLDDTLVLGGYECAMHGHQSSNGSKGSLKGLAKTFKKQIIGHTHTPEQFNFNLVVGHNVSMDKEHMPDYIKGGTSTWMTANVLIYPGGQAQHVFIIDGHFKAGEKIKFKKNKVAKMSGRFLGDAA